MQVDLARVAYPQSTASRAYTSRDHCLPALRYLNVLNDYHLLPATAKLLQSQKALQVDQR